MYWVTLVVLLVFSVFAWFIVPVLGLKGQDIWMLRGALILLGTIGASVALWYQHSVKKREEQAAGEQDGQGGGGGSGTDDLDAVVREAARRLKRSTLGKGTDLSSQPLVFFLGDPGSTKTTILIHSALDPELLAGQVYRDTEVLPTTAANVWYTRQAIFVDPAGDLMGQPDRWKRLMRLMQPARFSAAIGKKTQAPRAAVVCFDCETFLQPGASEVSISAARRLSVRLQEVSQTLGISFPVYVLFTRTDRISFFTEFVRGMSKDEANEVLGTTLPLRSLSAGVYADEETRRLAKAFDEIFYSLAERRTQLLPRENESDKLPGIYEFPRELNKLRTLLVQFLVDLLRPSHLGTNPFLRGFYFTGVRPVVVDDIAAARSAPIEAEESDLGAGATQIFRGVGGKLQAAPSAPRAVGPRRMPQWVFLTNLFNEVLAKDRVALAASGSSSRVNMVRRLVLGAAVFLGLVLLMGFTISFFRNRLMESRVQEEVADLRAVQPTTTQPAVLADLQKLEALRQDVAMLSDYEQNGAPWSMRWGLYSGDRVYHDAKPVYFDRFNRLLFAETLGRIRDNLSLLQGQSAANAPDGAFDKAYNQLKAYLITTEPLDHDKSTKEFLSPQLMQYWVNGRDIDKDRKDLASTQFDFYATELAREIPFTNGYSKMLVDSSRAYLDQFAGIKRYYALLLAKASKDNPDVSFNDKFPDSVGTIASSRKVRGAFTRGGFQVVQDALQNPATFATGEVWVVGKTGAQDMDSAALRVNLTQLYNVDFVKEWNEVLRTSSVTPYRDNADAEKKLDKLTSPTTPLLELFYFVSHNIDVAPADVKQSFAPVQTVEPPGPPDKLPPAFIVGPAKDYIGSLTKIQSDIHALVENSVPTDQGQTNLNGSIKAGYEAAKSVYTSLPVDAQYKNQDEVHRLLREPILDAENISRKLPGDAANGSAKGYCFKFGDVAKKYPFNANASQDASLEELYSVFGPTSDSLKDLQDKIKQFTLKVGSQYAANPQAPAKPLPSFLHFLNQVGGMSEAFYPSGSAPPHLSYTLRQLPSNLEGVKITIGSDTLGGDSGQKTFTWSGAPEDVSVMTKGGDILYTFKGTWAVFKFVSTAHYLGSGKLEWVSEINGHPVLLPDGKVKSFDYQLSVTGSENPFFGLAGMKCIPLAVGK